MNDRVTDDETLLRGIKPHYLRYDSARQKWGAGFEAFLLREQDLEDGLSVLRLAMVVGPSAAVKPWLPAVASLTAEDVRVPPRGLDVETKPTNPAGAFITGLPRNLLLCRAATDAEAARAIELADELSRASKLIVDPPSDVAAKRLKALGLAGR